MPSFLNSLRLPTVANDAVAVGTDTVDLADPLCRPGRAGAEDLDRLRVTVDLLLDRLQMLQQFYQQAAAEPVRKAASSLPARTVGMARWNAGGRLSDNDATLSASTPRTWLMTVRCWTSS